MIVYLRKKKCFDCPHDGGSCIPIKFEFNYFTLEIDCYWKQEFFSSFKTSEYYYKNNYLHNLDGPAVINYDIIDGTIVRKAWYKNGQYQRETGI